MLVAVYRSFLVQIRQSARWRCGIGLAVFALSAGMVFAQNAPVISEPLRLDEVSTACQGLRVAALGPMRAVIAWTVAEAPRPGVYYRQRQNLLWGPVRQVAGAVGEHPRDVDLAFDARNRLHLVWTAMDGARRTIHRARLDEPDGSPRPRPWPPLPARKPPATSISRWWRPMRKAAPSSSGRKARRCITWCARSTSWMTRPWRTWAGFPAAASRAWRPRS